MSAGVCGKRVGFKENFGSSSSSAKKAKYSSYESLTLSPESGSWSNSLVLSLIQKFPALDPELVKTFLRNHNYKIDDATESLREISFGYAVQRNDSQNSDSATVGNCEAVSGPSAATLSEQEVENGKTTIKYEVDLDKTNWADLFVQEMMNSAGPDDARGRTARILEYFERSITTHCKASKELEHASLKKHLQSLLNDNQILKRAVAIQHQHGVEHEEKTREVQNLRGMLSHYQEQIRSLELNNYSLKLHLQRAQQSNYIGQFPPDIY